MVSVALFALVWPQASPIGHLFQGRYRAEMIEDESYYWTVSRYIHLNAVRARLVERPEDWRWSSFPAMPTEVIGFSWMSYESLLSACQGEFGVMTSEGLSQICVGRLNGGRCLTFSWGTRWLGFGIERVPRSIAKSRGATSRRSTIARGEGTRRNRPGDCI